LRDCGFQSFLIEFAVKGGDLAETKTTFIENYQLISKKYFIPHSNVQSTYVFVNLQSVFIGESQRNRG